MLLPYVVASERVRLRPGEHKSGSAVIIIENGSIFPLLYLARSSTL